MFPCFVFFNGFGILFLMRNFEQRTFTGNMHVFSKYQNR